MLLAQAWIRARPRQSVARPESDFGPEPISRSDAQDRLGNQMRLAVAELTKQDGDWGERPNYFDVTCSGALAYLSKGRGAALSGRLRWREYESPEGQRREAVDVVAAQVKFTSGRPAGRHRRRGDEWGARGGRQFGGG